MKGWHNESYSHMLAAKGIKVKPIKYVKAPRDAEYEFVGVDSKGRRVRLYDKTHKKAASDKKFNRIRRLEIAYPKILNKIENDVNSNDLEKRENARAAYVIVNTGLRPGSEKDTKGDVQAYGVTTLEKNQVKTDGRNVNFKFVGKKGVLIEKKIVDSRMARIIKEQKEVPGKQLFPNVSDASLRRYFRTHGKYSTKDYRTLRANQLAKRLIKKGATDKQVIEGVAKDLSNTPGVSKSAYVDPEAFI
jgi:DNA topoisomerase-1